jgi:hypothetical protein
VRDLLVSGGIPAPSDIQKTENSFTKTNKFRIKYTVIVALLLFSFSIAEDSGKINCFAEK